MLSILCVILTKKVKVGIPESFKVGWYPLKKTGSSHLSPGLIRPVFCADNSLTGYEPHAKDSRKEVDIGGGKGGYPGLSYIGVDIS